MPVTSTRTHTHTHLMYRYFPILQCYVVYIHLQSAGDVSEESGIDPNMPDVCIVYQLYLECGKLINVKDWRKVSLHIPIAIHIIFHNRLLFLLWLLMWRIMMMKMMTMIMSYSILAI